MRKFKFLFSVILIFSISFIYSSFKSLAKDYDNLIIYEKTECSIDTDIDCHHNKYNNCNKDSCISNLCKDVEPNRLENESGTGNFSRDIKNFKVYRGKGHDYEVYDFREYNNTIDDKMLHFPDTNCDPKMIIPGNPDIDPKFLHKPPLKIEEDLKMEED
ncbi:MAG TPA: hypothetical protein GXX20_03720 [Clostridiaceae bacterium]|nr:hypothetical protein [Clostridiaceae bacterium]